MVASFRDMNLKKRIRTLTQSIETGILGNLGDYHKTALEVWYRAEYYEVTQPTSPKNHESGVSV
ncbi:hypothetical protein BDZ89DRAFT_1057851 [Hymenopellis radicata]|nr:hypothetical protein BDZ89DRAFT_1057851 [Hymenopellis radicata]